MNLKDKLAGYRLGSDMELMNQSYILGSDSGLWDPRPWVRAQLCHISSVS